MPDVMASGSAAAPHPQAGNDAGDEVVAAIAEALQPGHAQEHRRKRYDAAVPAYVLVEVRVTNPPAYAGYRDLAGPSVARHGGRFLVRGGAVTPLEGDWHPERLVVIEFADVDAARAWYWSADYQAALAIRLANSVGRAVMVEGYAG